MSLHLEELALESSDHAWLELVLLSGYLCDLLDVFGGTSGLLSGIEFGSIVEELVVLEAWWLSCVGGHPKINIALPVLVSLGLLSLDPLHVACADLLGTSLFAWGLSNGGKGVSGNSRWILKTDIVAVNINTSSTSWILIINELFVIVHGDSDIFSGVVVDVTADTDIVSWNWSAEVSSSLLVSLLVCGGDEFVVVHDIMPEGKFHSADEGQDSLEVGLGDPVSDVGKIGTVTHAGGNGVSVEETSWELVTWGPGVTESVWSALMGLPKVSIFRSDVTFHGLSNDVIAEILEVSIIVATLSTEFGSNKSWSSLLDKLEKRFVLDASHLDDLGDSVSDPTLVERFPEVSIGQGEDWWMIGTVEVLETETIAAGSWGRTGINTSNNRGTEHDVRSVSMVKCSSKTSGIGNDTTSHDEDWLVSSDSIVLEINKNLLNTSDILIDFVTSVNKLDDLDVVGLEVLIESLSIDLLDFVIDDGNASSEWSIVVSKELVLWVQNSSGDFDGSSNGGAHDSLDAFGIWGSKSAAITVSVDAGWVDGMWVDLLKGIVVLEVLFGDWESLFVLLHKVLQSDVGQSSVCAQFLDTLGEVWKGLLEALSSLLDQKSVLSEWQVGEVLELLGDGQKIEVGAQSFGELFGEDWESRKIYEELLDVS